MRLDVCITNNIDAIVLSSKKYNFISKIMFTFNLVMVTACSQSSKIIIKRNVLLNNYQSHNG